jgi:hypothetical protein
VTDWSDSVTDSFTPLIRGRVNKKAEMRQNLHTGKNFLSNLTKHREYYMKMAWIFQQCANCFEKEACINTV